MAINNGLLNVLIARNEAPELMLEAYMNGKVGLVNTVSFKRIAEKQKDERVGREAAEATASQQRRVLDAGTRKYLNLQKNEAVSPVQRKEFSDALIATGDDASPIIVPKDSTSPDVPTKVVKPRTGRT